MEEDSFKDPEKITETMKAGLAKLYADEDIRAYLLHMVNVYNHNILVSLRGHVPEKATEFTAKYDAIKKLLENGKLMYSQAEKLKQTPLAELVKEHGAN